jgi:ribonuclease HI
MSAHGLWKVHIDGAARGNPGPAAYAFVLAADGKPAVEEKGCLGSATNNVAEYTALLRALTRAAELGAARLLVHSDSELLVKQMNGEYRVKNESLKELFDEAKQLTRKFQEVTLVHVRREQNKRADELCNQALDGEKGTSERAAPRVVSMNVPSAPAREAAVREEAVACLQAAANHWARGNAHDPSPAVVWEQLWSILEENGALKTAKRK